MMIDPVEKGLSKLRAAPFDCDLDHLESSVWARVEAQARADVFRGKTMQVQLAATCAALIMGLVMAEWVGRDAAPVVSEMAVLSDVGALVPSVFLGGGV